MKRFLLLAVLGSTLLQVHAQSSRQRVDASSITGHFNVIKMSSKGEEHINVNYALFPAPFVDIVKLNLNTPDPMMLHVKLVSANGNTIKSWKPDHASYRYDQQFDISMLSAGLYHIDIYDANNNKLYSVPFTRQLLLH